ncbi:MAG: hypothetical protein IK997_05550 [Bacilli bacterium]|nr:hypothetical protein [Bacilli bacterium]
MYMSEEDEKKIYHIFCRISNICKNYFYERKYLPNDGWSIDSRIEMILEQAKRLDKKYNEFHEKYYKEEEVWDTDQMSE